MNAAAPGGALPRRINYRNKKTLVPQCPEGTLRRGVLTRLPVLFPEFSPRNAPVNNPFYQGTRYSNRSLP
jgi:hypothetical protein